MDSLLEAIVKTEEHQFCVEMMKRLDIQRRNEHCCDVILEVGCGDDHARLKAHRIVLCAASPFFFNAFNSDMKEKKEGVIRLEEMSKDVMEEVLKYLYTGHVDISEANGCDLMAAADFFLLPTLKDLCGKVIAQALSFSSCITAYYLAKRYRCEELQIKARDFILANFVAVAETEEFLNLSSAQVEEWISSDEIVVKGEEDVFEVVVKWIAGNERRNQSVSDLFRLIRLIYIRRDFLLNVVLSNPLIKNSKECSNLVLDAMKLVFSGTEDCYFAQPARNCIKTHEDAIVARGTRKSTLCYIPSKNKWYQLAKMSSSRPKYCQSTSSCHKKMYCIGGNAGGYPAECYDPTTNTWTPLKSFNQAIQFAAVVTFQGLLYVIGGTAKNKTEYSTVQTYNPETNLWQKAASLSIARGGICAVACNNFLYAVGGSSNNCMLKIVEKFDATEKAWMRVAPTLEGRASACGAAANQKVFVFGGLADGVTQTTFCEVYDPAIDIWSSITSTVISKLIFVSAVSFKGKIYVCGCFGQDGSQEISLQEYDAESNEWKFFTVVSPGPEKYDICSLRIPKDILNECTVVS
ncbi:kelch-like protein 28 [Oculina patagonica]